VDNTIVVTKDFTVKKFIYIAFSFSALLLVVCLSVTIVDNFIKKKKIDGYIHSATKAVIYSIDISASGATVALLSEAGVMLNDFTYAGTDIFPGSNEEVINIHLNNIDVKNLINKSIIPYERMSDMDGAPVVYMNRDKSVIFMAGWGNTIQAPYDIFFIKKRRSVSKLDIKLLIKDIAGGRVDM
jgi:hypothetical protein